jgi:predicted O-methyltransferase YrrM
MTRRTVYLPEELHEYLVSISVREPEVLRRLREETASLEEAEMQISPEQGQFMAFLVKLLGAKRTLEVGIFTGYSSTWVALALPQDGELVACDISEEYTVTASRYWKEAGVADKIELRLGPAQDTLDALVGDAQSNTFDFVFIDADKLGYDAYYESCLQLLRPGGVIAIDNALRRGRVIEEETDDEITIALRAFNQKLFEDQRVDVSLVPISDGLMLARKR